jgi:cell division septation protein DedD
MGALAGCAVGFGIGIVAVAGTAPRWRPLPAPEAPVTARLLVPAVTAAPPAEAAVRPPVAVEAPQPAAIQAPPPAETPMPAPAATDAPSPPPPAAVVADPPPVVEPKAAAPNPTEFAIQVGTFRDPANAARLAARLEAGAHRVTVEPGAPDDSLWVVLVGSYPDRGQADAVRAGLEQQGLAGLLVSRRPEREHDDVSRQARASK